jgi:hypothetical protein
MNRTAAINAGTTQFPKNVAIAGISPLNGRATSILKEAKANSKLGGKARNFWTKGKFANMPLFSLTLVERETCPSTCSAWAICYGNNMPFATRWDIKQDGGKLLMRELDAEMALLNRYYPNGFSVRLHVLGDFFSVEYVKWWGEMLEKYPALHCYGYTHNADNEIWDAIAEIRGERFVIRQSDGHQFPVAVRESIDNSFPTCPEQTGKVKSCLDCGLCPNMNVQGIRFLEH